MTHYTRTFTTTCPSALVTEIQSAIGTTLLQLINVGDGDTVFDFNGDLSGAEVTALDNILAGWACPPPSSVNDGPFCIFAEENSNISVGTNNYEYSFGNGAVNTTADPPGIPMGVDCTLIGIGFSSRGTTSGTNSASISVTRNGTIVATSEIFSSTGTNIKVNGNTEIVPNTVDFAPGDTLQFLTGSVTGGHDDARVVAWFERTSTGA